MNTSSATRLPFDLRPSVERITLREPNEARHQSVHESTSQAARSRRNRLQEQESGSVSDLSHSRGREQGNELYIRSVPDIPHTAQAHRYEAAESYQASESPRLSGATNYIQAIRVLPRLHGDERQETQGTERDRRRLDRSLRRRENLAIRRPKPSNCDLPLRIREANSLALPTFAEEVENYHTASVRGNENNNKEKRGVQVRLSNQLWAENRLTIQQGRKVGFLTRGKSSKPVTSHIRGNKGLIFNEREFLKRSRPYYGQVQDKRLDRRERVGLSKLQFQPQSNAEWRSAKSVKDTAVHRRSASEAHIKCPSQYQSDNPPSSAIQTSPSGITKEQSESQISCGLQADWRFGCLLPTGQLSAPAKSGNMHSVPRYVTSPAGSSPWESAIPARGKHFCVRSTSPKEMATRTNAPNDVLPRHPQTSALTFCVPQSAFPKSSDRTSTISHSGQIASTSSNQRQALLVNHHGSLLRHPQHDVQILSTPLNPSRQTSKVRRPGPGELPSPSSPNLKATLETPPATQVSAHIILSDDYGYSSPSPSRLVNRMHSDISNPTSNNIQWTVRNRVFSSAVAAVTPFLIQQRSSLQTEPDLQEGPGPELNEPRLFSASINSGSSPRSLYSAVLLPRHGSFDNLETTEEEFHKHWQRRTNLLR